jgi:hypothetical protein
MKIKINNIEADYYSSGRHKLEYWLKILAFIVSTVVVVGSIGMLIYYKL